MSTMLIIFLMAILSLDLIHCAAQNRSIESRHGNALQKYSNGTIVVRQTTTAKPREKSKKKILVRLRKSRRNDTVPAATSGTTRPKKKPTPKSDMQLMQFYAQPLPTIDISYHAPIYENYNPMMNGVLNMNEHALYTATGVTPTLEPIQFKPLDDQQLQPITNWNLQQADRLQRLPIYDPFNTLKRKPIVPLRVHKPGPKFVPALRAITPVTTLPPITVTHIYKYEETNSGLKMPFDDDPIVENFPALSAALDAHDRAAEIARLKGYMMPPKIHQPIYYNMPIVELSTLTPINHNEYDILHKFNEAIKTQQNPQSEFEYEDSKETQEEKNYTDEDVKKALEYIQHLKKSRPKPNRGSKKFNEDRSPKHKKSKESEESEEETGKKRKPKDSEEDDFAIKSFEELDEEESHKKIVKSKSKHKSNDKTAKVDTDVKGDIDHIGYQESQIVPTLEDQEDAPPDFSQNTIVGGESSEDRVEFQMHGLRGPESYKFGYDTGKGENRQFRYEERDPDGKVKGHFGYYDNDGKLQVFNYEADPEHGYHLEQAQ